MNSYVTWAKPFVIRVNGKTDVSRPEVMGAILYANEFLIGAADVSGRYLFSGFVGEILILTAIPADDGLVKLESELMQKWRIRH